MKSATDGLTDLQRRFADEYMVDFNATAAFARAGYKARGESARVDSCRMLAKPEIQVYLRQRKTELLTKLEVTQTEVLHRVAALGLGDIRKLFDDRGALKAMHELTIDEQALIQAIEVNELYSGSGDERTPIGYTKKIKLVDRHAAAKTLGGHFGLFSTRVEHTGKNGGPIVTRTWVDELLDDVQGAGTGLPPPHVPGS